MSEQLKQALDRILRIREVMAVTGLPKSSVYQEIAAGKFPRPVRLSAKCVGWKSSVIQQWIDSREEAGHA